MGRVRYPRRAGRKEQGGKGGFFFFQCAVCGFVLVCLFSLLALDNGFTNRLRLKLKTAITEDGETEIFETIKTAGAGAAAVLKEKAEGFFLKDTPEADTTYVPAMENLNTEAKNQIPPEVILPEL